MATLPELDPPAVAELGARLTANVDRAVKVPEQVIRNVLVSLFSEGHVLIEDYPGVGKTALARALETLSRDSILRHRMGEAGRKRVAERFTQTAMAEKHIELYERIRGH